LAKYAPAGKKKLAQFKDIGAGAAKVKLDKEAIDLKGGSPPVFEDDTWVIQVADFADLTERKTYKEDELELRSVNPWTRAASLMERGTLYGVIKPTSRDSKKIDYELSQWAKIAYLLVLRVDQYEPATGFLDFQEAGLGDFTPGKVDGVGLLYRLGTADPLGGFRFSAKNDTKVEFRYKEGEDKNKAAEEWLRSNLWVNATAAINARYKALVPAGKLPFSK